jgi:hypothetical protein
MRLTRRHLLTAAGAVSAFAITERAVRTGTTVVGAALGAMRPPVAGTSADRCALCGSPDHAMLDPRCPRSRPSVREA